MSEAAGAGASGPRAGGLRWLWLSGLVLALDQATKLAAVRLLAEREIHSLLPGFNLTLVYNPGAAFSFLGDAGGWQRWFLSTVGIVVSVVLGLLLRSAGRGPKGLAAGYALVLGGALGNVVDRLYLGVVVDFIDIYYGRFHWPAFNVADSAICAGALLLVVHALRDR